MPAEHSPSNGELPFAPRGVRFEQLGVHSLFVRGDQIGYRLVINRRLNSAGYLKKPTNLRWDVRLTLQAVDRWGRPKRLILQKSRHLGAVRYPVQEFAAQPKPGVYRLDLTIKDWAGKQLVDYHQYLRVLPVHVRLVVAASGTVFHPGDVVIGRIENRGTVTAVMLGGGGLTVERYDGAQWSEFRPNDGRSDSFGGPDTFLYGGQAGSCTGFPVPLDAPPGAYRVSSVVRSFGWTKNAVLASYFSVS